MRNEARSDHRNNFGSLRLLFAALVIVSHSPELIDGNRSREILTRVFGTMSFGEVAVDGFFLVSGYLITKSFAERPEVLSYMLKRVLRIAPGYLVSFWLCVLVLAPFVGVDDSAVSFQLIKHNILRNFGLLYPDVPGAFNSLPYATLNGAMWTISYEFRCYLAVVFVGVIGWLFGLAPTRSRWIILAFVLAGITVNGLGLLNGLAGFHEGIIGSPEKNCRLFSVFGVGSLFYMFRERIMLTDYGAIGAAVFLLILLFNRYTAEAGIALFGGYLIFWFALKYKVLRISVADNKNDISYGLYLYAWPIQNLIIWNERTIDPWVLCLITLIGAGLAGYVSWHFIEKRANALARRGQPPVAPRVMRGPTPDHQTRFDTDYL